MLQLAYGYTVGFRHVPDEINGIHPGTECIVANEETQESAMGVSFVHPHDQFCKVTGRKVAFAKALKKLGIKRNRRRMLWRRLFNQVRFAD